MQGKPDTPAASWEKKKWKINHLNNNAAENGTNQKNSSQHQPPLALSFAFKVLEVVTGQRVRLMPEVQGDAA